MSKESQDCRVSCTGLYADVQYNQHENKDDWKDHQKYIVLQSDYSAYKRNYARNIVFNDTNTNLSMTINSII